VQENAIAIVGVGYVGLPLAMTLAKHHAKVIAYDIDEVRIDELNTGIDRNNSEQPEYHVPVSLTFTAKLEDIRVASTYIITVPTPIDENRLPDLTVIREVCCDIATLLSPNDLIIIESTVYPGVTEEICGPLIEEKSGLARGIEFSLGYSPERINPGDNENKLESVVKVVAAQDEVTLERVKKIYAPAIKAGLFVAPSIQIAEAAKIVENVQRDLNVALMNELALIFDRMGIRTADVLEAANTKWNFQKFTPGLVGGHCIGVDPYYLISKAESLGYYPELIRAARRLNSSLAEYVSQKTMDLLAVSRKAINQSRIGVLGLTFKEDVSDFRNSQSPIVVNEFLKYGGTVFSHDPYACKDGFLQTYGINLSQWCELKELDAVVVIVPHKFYTKDQGRKILRALKEDAIFIDVKSAFDSRALPESIRYWSL
tara:strand:- start:2067 stop:3350 length:1284 start_codon:yes stop_codon:yes gene_type:complete